GHDAEARALESLGADMIDESEVLTPADPFFHVNKRAFEVPFVCGARSLGEAVRRIWEGAAMIRTKGEAGTGDVVEAVRHIRLVVHFAAGGVATPADAALMMLMGCDGVFVGSGIFKAENPETRGRAIVDAVAHFDDPSTVAEVSKGIGLAMKGLDAKALPIEARLQDRGWWPSTGAHRALR